MNVTALIPKSAWCPLTPQGVAAFASGRLGRLWLVQFLFALLAGIIFGWLIHTAWLPVIREAIGRLPAGAQIQGGVLQWPGEAPVLLAENRFLGLVVDLDHTGEVVSVAPVEVEFGRRDWQVSSLFGVLHLPGLLNTSYPAGYTIAFSHAELSPWWGAREPFLLAFAMAGMVVGLMVTWTVLATVYFPLVWLVGFFANRQLNWAGSWRLAGAALMPGAVAMSAAMVLYGLQVLDLFRFGLAVGLHFVVGWFFLFVGPLFRPRQAGAAPSGGNPFVAPK
jgi:hypothetical protein